MKRTGIMGGTFNPIHNGHLIVAQYAMEQYGLDEVIFMTGGNPPHKNQVTDCRLRYEMVKLALGGFEKFTADDYEVKKADYCYSIETIKHLKKKRSDEELFFIIGEDSLIDMTKWYKPDEILKLVPVLVYPRGTQNDLDEAIDKIKGILGGDIRPVNAPVFGVSSTEIRERIRTGKNVELMIPQRVAEYINQKKLYTERDEKDMKKKLEAALKPKRYRHSLGVCAEAVKLAEIYGADCDKAYTAGLLHDCAKGFDSKKQLELCKAYGLVLDDTTMQCHPVIHAPLGAEVARHEYGIEDEEILEAIRCHTVGKANMTKLDKIIYVADMIEPGRDFDGVEQLRKCAYKNLDDAVIMALKQSIVFNAKKEVSIHPATIEAWNFMLSKSNKK